MRATLFLALFLALPACGKSKSTPPTGTGSSTSNTATTTAVAPPSSGQDPKTIYSQRCVPCHGERGAGDGAASASLNPKPRDFTDPAWQTSVTDEYLEKIIKFGGAGVGKSPAMPNNPDLTDPATITGLKDIVRSFKK